MRWSRGRAEAARCAGLMGGDLGRPEGCAQPDMVGRDTDALRLAMTALSALRP